MRKIHTLSSYYGVTFFRASQNCTKIVPEKVILGVTGEIDYIYYALVMIV